MASISREKLIIQGKPFTNPTRTDNDITFPIRKEKSKKNMISKQKTKIPTTPDQSQKKLHLVHVLESSSCKRKGVHLLSFFVTIRPQNFHKARGDKSMLHVG